MEHIKTQSGGRRTLDPHHGHEVTDINIRAVLGFGFVLFISAVIIHVGLWGFYVLLDRHGEKFAPELSMQGEKAFQKSDALVGTNKQSETAAQLGETQQQTMKRLVSTFPTPRLQDDDVRDMAELHANEGKYLGGYAWTDQAHGKVRIPIERAMELLVERGLPIRAAQPVGATQAQAQRASQSRIQATGQQQPQQQKR
jgi:hypothetical protein